jgi:hypothetical protein
MRWYSKVERRERYRSEDLRPELLQTVPVCERCHNEHHRRRALQFRPPEAYAASYDRWLARYVAGDI